MHKKIKDLALAVALLGVSVFSLVTIGATPEQSRIASAAKLSYASLPKTYGWALVILVGWVPEPRRGHFPVDLEEEDL